MTRDRFQDIWKDQCDAARSVREKFGVVKALDYLIGEKLMTFAEAAATRPEFARELPQFVGEIRRIFEHDEIRVYIEHLERMDAIREEEIAAEPEGDDGLIDDPERREEARVRFARLKELLTSSILGTA